MNFKKKVSGSWTDTPHYIHNTSTDTITTLPAVIHPTGTTATVGLKGNTLQSSIPSPTSPVMPQGTGDLETSGTKAGQYKIPISSANTTTPVYLGEVQSTRKVKKLVLTGEEGWILQSINPYGVANYSLSVSGRNTTTRFIMCTHYEQQNTSIDNTRTSGIYNGSNIFIRDTSITTLADFKAWLAAQYAAGTPVTVWYVLATEETTVVNEPLMKIGDYADTLGDISIPVTAGGDTLSVGTTVQPSEVTLNYKGWHPVQNVHERDNGAWT